MFDEIRTERQKDGSIIEWKQTPVGKAKKQFGTWLLEEFGLKNFHYPGKHPAWALIYTARNWYRDLMWGYIYQEDRSEYRPEYEI